LATQLARCRGASYDYEMDTRQPSAQHQLFDTSLGTAPGRGRLANQQLLVVGAGQRATPDPTTTIGNGRAMSLLFAREGATVFCADRDLASAQETVELIRLSGHHAYAIEADVSDPEAIAAIYAYVDSAGVVLNGVVANIGISSGRNLTAESPETWDAVMNVNLRAHMLLAQLGLKKLAVGGSIVFISSAASISPLGRVPSYEASKAALSALARSTAMEGQSRGIRANALAPGLLDTPMGRAASERNPARALRPVPFGRQGTAWEMAYAVLFLISTESSYVNAQTIFVDGGQSARISSAPT
jgi:NAD(P)-dependent dehydrogenase (short-subunit alcohol dehydrogenase family)